MKIINKSIESYLKMNT